MDFHSLLVLIPSCCYGRYINCEDNNRDNSSRRQCD